MNARQQRGQQIATTCVIVEKDGSWLVPSQSGKGRYRVTLDGDSSTCTCKDFETRQIECKHVFAARVAREREPDAIPKPPELRTADRVKRPTYRQDWKAYNAAQTNEKARLQILLHDLCRGVTGPTRKPGPGQNPLPFADAIFASAYKVYSTFSGRRFMTDLRNAHEAGYLSRPVHYNSIFKHLGEPGLTPILRDLISESARPLASVDIDFAADSSGFTTCRFESWYDHKYGVTRRQHSWVKVDIMTGVKTNIVTAVEIKDKDASDPKQLPALLDTTAERFTMREVSADKVYASLDNYARIAGHGAAPYIPFKSIHTGAGGGLWEKMYHYYNLNREEFLSHYHKRSNVESTFSMIKAKFGDAVRSKTGTAMVNEVLCKILCHNLCCLIQSAYELKITAAFWGSDPEPQPQSSADPMVDLVEAWAWV